jgi:hypothetical protein
MKFSAWIVLVSVFSVSFAEAALYRLDDSKVAPEDREMVNETCAREIRVRSERSMEAEIVAQVTSRRISSEKIETSRSTLTTDGTDAYSGEVKTGVYLVKLDGYGSYSPFIMKRVEINTYPTALTVRIELLNHRDSAELAEESVCGNLSYLKVSEKL